MQELGKKNMILCCLETFEDWEFVASHELMKELNYKEEILIEFKH